MAPDYAATYPPRLAVAVRLNKRSVRLMVYEVLVGADTLAAKGSSALCTAQCEVAESLQVKVDACVTQMLSGDCL